MRKKVATLILCLAAVCGAMAQKTSKIMTVEQKDGTKVVYKVKNVEHVTFTEREQPELNNQWAYNEDVNAIGTVVLHDMQEKYVFDLYESESPQYESQLGTDKPAITVSVAKEAVGSSVDLNDDASQVVITKGDETVKPTGTLVVKFDKFFKQLTLSLDGEIGGNDDFCISYKGAFKRSYTATGCISVTPKDGEAVESAILSQFIVRPATTGEATQFAFADAEGTTPADVKTGKCAVWLTISASKLHAGDIDMATETDSYSFTYIDYATGTTTTTVTAGTITSAEDYLGNTYLKVNATLEDGTVVECEYVGSYTDAESLEDLIPTPVLANGWHYYNSDGEETVNAEVNKVLYKVNSSNGYTTYYFYRNADDSKYASDKITLQVKDDWVNAGAKDLSALVDGDWFSVKYSDIQLVSPDSKYSGYGLVPNNGTLTISKDDEGNYDIYLDITNKYNCSGTGITDGGNNARLVLSFKGQMTGTY